MDTKLVGEEGHPFPAWLSFHLNNPIRRHFHSPEKVINAIGLKETDTVLDFGCGPGFYTVPFAKTAREVVAVDIQPKMLEKASKYAEKDGVNVKTIKSNGESISLPDASFDVIFLSFVYHEISDKAKVLTELSRLLKPQGRIVVRERTEPDSIILGPPSVDRKEVFRGLKAAGLTMLATTADPSDKRITLMTATKK